MQARYDSCFQTGPYSFVPTEALARRRPDIILASRLDRIHSSQTQHNQPEPNHICAGFAHFVAGSLWKNATESESRKLVVGWLVFVRPGPDDSCTQACFWTRCIWPKPDQAIQVRSGLVFNTMTQAFFGRTELNQMQHIWSGPILAACWL